MGKQKFKPVNTIDSNILNRIDSIKSDKDFNPYEAQKKHTVDNNELFDHELYMTEEEIEKADPESINTSSKAPVIITIVTILIIAIVAVVVILKVI